jgi:hypothetical protein
MPKKQRTKGYDPLFYYTRLELREMFRAEGYSTREAISKARHLYWKIRQINDAEAYSWNKARELESAYGIGEKLDQTGGQYGDFETIWDVIDDMAQLDQGKITHYERFRRQRMRIKRQKERGSTGNQTGSQANEEPGEPVPIQGPEGK